MAHPTNNVSAPRKEDDATRYAARRARREPGQCFTVYRTPHLVYEWTFYVRNSKDAAPDGASVLCIAQHWSGDTVQLRYRGARSEWLHIAPDDAPACGGAIYVNA